MTFFVVISVAKEGYEVACRGEADPENLWILTGVDEGICESRVKPVFQADPCRVRRARERGRRTV